MRLVIATLSLVGLAGCSSAQWIEIQIQGRGLDSDLPFDTLVVEVAASTSEEISSESQADTCEVARRVFPEDGESLELPIPIVISSESTNWKWVAVRATGLVGGATGQEVIRNDGLYGFPGHDGATLLLMDECLHEEGVELDCDIPEPSPCCPGLANELFDSIPSIGESCDSIED